MSSVFDTIQSEIFELMDASQDAVPQGDALFYSGSFMTGQMAAPELLLLGINPGHGDWNNRKRLFPRQPFAPRACKFVAEYEDRAPLATAIVDILLGRDSARLAHCAETSVQSFFGTPDVGILKRQLGHLAKAGLLERHNAMMASAVTRIIAECQPREIVCIGLTTFHSLCRLLGLNGQPLEMRSEKSASGKTEPVYYKRAEFDRIAIHGTLHLSGGRPSASMLKDLQTIFAQRDG